MIIYSRYVLKIVLVQSIYIKELEYTNNIQLLLIADYTYS